MDRLSVQRIDWVLLLAVLAVVGVGLPFLQSASPASFERQLLWIALGLFAMVAVLAVDYRLFLRFAYEIYAAALGLLTVVLLLPPVRGAHSWIRLPYVPFSIQPSEVAKVAMVLVLARHLMRKENTGTLRGLALPFALLLAPMALILKQPDLGTAVLLPPLLFALLFAKGARVLHLGGVAAAGAAAAVPLWTHVMKDYQKDRILAFLRPEIYEAREAYQLTMSLIAIGSGGLFGEGLGGGTLNSLDLLPDKHNDFIFGVVAEEGGFLAAASLLLGYMVIVYSGLAIAAETREPGGRLVAVGASAILGTQVLINVGVVTALLPTTGIPLPFISYGGSSMLISFALVGLLLNVGARRPVVVDRDPEGDDG